jgi:hypothetical protein
MAGHKCHQIACIPNNWCRQDLAVIEQCIPETFNAITPALHNVSAMNVYITQLIWSCISYLVTIHLALPPFY